MGNDELRSKSGHLERKELMMQPTQSVMDWVLLFFKKVQAVM